MHACMELYWPFCVIYIIVIVTNLNFILSICVMDMKLSWLLSSFMESSNLIRARLRSQGTTSHQIRRQNYMERERDIFPFYHGM